MKSFLKTLAAVVLGTGFVLVLGIIFLIGSLSSLVQLQSSLMPSGVPNNAMLVLDFRNGVSNQDSNNPLYKWIPEAAQLGIETGGTGFLKIISAIDHAALDPSVRMIYLNPQYLNASQSHIEEIRNALLRFRESGKAVISYADTYSQRAYYLASAADRILLNPNGTVSIQGFSVSSRYYKDLLDKYGLEVQVVRHGSFKSGGENYTLSRMSDAERQQLNDYIQSAWGHWCTQMESTRHLEAGTINQLSDKAFFLDAKTAAEYGLIDQIQYKDELIDTFCSLYNVTKERALPTLSLVDYSTLTHQGTRRLSKNKIAVVYAIGEVAVGQGGNQDILSDTYAAYLRQIRTDSTYKALVVRVDSPGGDPVAADIIARELSLISQKKPVVISMGDQAASGGYWIAAPADAIYVNPTTLTGSIGAFSIFFNGEKALNQLLHVHNETVSSNRHSDLPSYTRSMNTDELAMAQALVDSTYRQFITLVAEGRNMSKQQVDTLAQGRIWSGVQAVQNHLADHLGGLSDAIAGATLLAECATDYRTVEFPNSGSFMEQIMGSLSETAISDPLEQANQWLKKLSGMHGVQAITPYKITY